MNIVITMAGLGSRFKQAGYKVPKYRIEVSGKTLFEWSMLSLKGFSEKNPHYIFIVRREDNSLDFIKEKCSFMKIERYCVVEIDALTDGQATTAMLAEKFWLTEKPLLIYNIDTYVEAGAMKASQLKGDGFIPCFRGKGDHWSFVKLDDGGTAVEVREKVRISEHCTIGAYYFKTCELYKALYTSYYDKEENLEKGEKYVAPLYNRLIAQGGKVYISSVEKEKVHALGTPEEVEAFKRSINEGSLA